jgi:hypothetical protein
MLLIGLVGSLVMTLTVTMDRAFTREQAATSSTSVAASGMNELTRVIRSGTEIPVHGQTLNDTVFTVLGPEEVVLHAYLDTDSTAPRPVRVRFALNGSRELVETRWDAQPVVIENRRYWTFPTEAPPTVVRTVARQIPAAASGAAPLFTFLRANGTAISPLPAAPTAIELREVAAVRIRLTVQADPTGRARPVTLQNTVGIPNLSVSRVGP